MGWSNKCGHRYYTRVRKANGRVYQEYIGGGIKGDQAAAADAARRAQWQELRNVKNAEKSRWNDSEMQMGDLIDVADLAMRTHLVLAGFFRHGGEWRKRREKESTN